MDKKTILSVGRSLAAIAAAGFSWWKTKQVEEEIFLRTKIVVIDVQGEMKQRLDAGKDRSEAAIELQQAGERLVAAGYLVVDRGYVYAYDPALQVSP